MTIQGQRRIALRLQLQSGVCSIPLHRVHHLTGYATLHGVGDTYFLGWLTFHGREIAVFDLNRVVCDEHTPESFGSRIILVHAGAESSVPYVGLLAAGVTDTVAAGDSEIEPLDLDSYLPMLCALIPAVSS
jgi:chemotaxis signal transduction protein